MVRGGDHHQPNWGGNVLRMLLCNVQENYAVAGIPAGNEQGFVGLDSLSPRCSRIDIGQGKRRDSSRLDSIHAVAATRRLPYVPYNTSTPDL